MPTLTEFIYKHGLTAKDIIELMDLVELIKIKTTQHDFTLQELIELPYKDIKKLKEKVYE